MRALITGVSGFVGTRLARHLQAQGDQVTGTYILDPPDLPDVELFEADLLDLEAMAEAIDSAEPEVVYHLAGLSHVGESWKAPGEYFRVNVLGTENLLRMAADARLILASSAEVYGLVPESEQPIAEERQPAPQSPYALTKASAERIALCHGAVVVRSFNIIGGGQAPNFALPAFSGQLAQIVRGAGEAVIRVGNLSAQRDFIHAEDAVEGYRIIAEDGVSGKVYNLGSGEAVSIGEALERLVAVSGVEARVEIDPDRFRPVDLPLLRADNRRAKALGWSPKRGLDAALQDLWEATLGQA